MQYHKVTTQIIDLLKDRNVWFEKFEHEPVRTSEEAAKIRDGYTLHQGAKAIIIRVKITTSNKKYIMLVIPGDMRFDTDKVKQIYNAKNVSFATVEEVSRLTDGVLPGGVPPFGNIFGLEVIVDPKLLENDKIIFNAGDRSFSVGMKSEDFKNIVKPKIEFIV